MSNELQSWTECYKELCERIHSSVPGIKHIDLYYGQENIMGDDGNWNPFRCPAVFLEFNAAQVEDVSSDAQHITTDIGVYLVYETTADSGSNSLGQKRALEFMGLLRSLMAALHNNSGEHYGPLSRVGLQRVEGPPYCIIYKQTFRSLLVDYAAQPVLQDIETPPLEAQRPAPAPVPDPSPLFIIS